MLQQIFATAWKDLKILLRDKGGLSNLFLMPLMFILVMSTALQGLFKVGTDSNPVLLPVVNQDKGSYAAEVISVMEEMDGIKVEQEWQGQILTLATAEDLIKSGKRQVVIYFPADFSEAITDYPDHSDSTAVIQMITDPALSMAYIAPIRGTVQGAAERVAETQIVRASIQSSLAAAFATLPEGDRPILDNLTGKLGNSNAVDLKQVSPAGMETEIEPDTYQQNVPGYTIMGVFFIVGIMASSLLTEKKEGTFRRLLVAPLSRGALLAGKVLPYYLVNLIQIAIMFLTAHFIFGMSFGDLPALIVVSLALSVTATSLGILVAALAKTDTQVGGLTSLLTLTMSALGGCLMPISIMPDFLQKISHVIPHTWAMQGYQDVLVRGYGVAGILPVCLVLLAFAVVFFGIGVWRFRFD